MSERKKLRYRISAVFAALAVMGLALAAGCGGGDESSEDFGGGYVPPAARAGASRRTAGPTGPGGGVGGAAPAGAVPGVAPAAAAGAAAAPVGPSGPALPTEEEKAERLAAFAGKYGPVTQSKVKDWDGREVEFVNFTHQGQKTSLPLSMVAEAKDPEALEGYFKVYPASAVPRKAASAKQVSASVGDEAADEDEEEATAEEPAAEADADAGAEDEPDGDSPAEPATTG